ncbi:MAG TPA: NepR family anti-sigma factor [Allosphingosinicella sp.]|nr:NepR family anti-sigma factor [Allosphingosinicella sp.]
MALVDEKDGQRRRKTEAHEVDDGPSEKSQRSKKRAPIPEVGNALRSAYEQTVSEDIPSEMLDLLGKLG